MQITHEAARKLIQFNFDDALNSQEKAVLSTHLKDCIECRAYADEIKEVESILLPAMKRQWNLRPAPLLLEVINAKRNIKIQTNTILAARTIAIGVICLAFIFSMWQFAASGGQEASPMPGGIPQIPTPSAQSTSTKIAFQNCAGTLYIVQGNDTLESIADQFSIPKEEIMAANHMKTEAIQTAMELVIPICNLTPTGTIDPALLTTTYTPSRNPMASTPGS